MTRPRLGQHFLKRDSVLRRIAGAACPQTEPLVVEVGPGMGALTAHLLTRSQRVIAIELDPGLCCRLTEKYLLEPRFQLVEGDASEMDLAQWGPAVIAGNLPYYAATPILRKVAHLVGPSVLRAVFLIQREVADRLTARPGTREYGYLTVETQCFCHAELLFPVPPAAFRPPPKVESAVVLLTPHRPTAEIPVSQPDRFLQFAGHCFQQKRKTLRNNLLPHYPKQAVDSLPQGRLRAEQLTIQELADVYRRLVG